MNYLNKEGTQELISLIKTALKGKLDINAKASSASTADKVNGHSVNSDVPTGAVFTDTHKNWGLSLTGRTITLVDGGTDKDVVIPEESVSIITNEWIDQNLV